MQPKPNPAAERRDGPQTPEPFVEAVYPALAPTAQVAVADGFGISIRVSQRHLVIEDGIGPQRRERRYSRATCPIRQLLILGHTGYVSLEAMRWCIDVGVHVVQIDKDGRLLATSAKRDVGVARLRRVQALATFTPIGVEVARYLLAAKIRGQAQVAAWLPNGAALMRGLDDFARRAEASGSIAEALDAEALAAQLYWPAWAGQAVTFATRDEPRVPEHWRSVGARSSPIAKDRRHAITPAHAILNYLYRLLEAETTLSLHASGLDPALGVFHRDERYRDSFTLDVMEAGRPAVDAYLHRQLDAQPFRRSDFHETERGVVRLLPPLTHRLAETLPQLHDAIEPHTLEVARILDRDIKQAASTLTFSASARRSEHKRSANSRRFSAWFPPAQGCRRCGTLLVAVGGTGDHVCPACPRDRANVSERRRESLSRRTRAVVEWDRANPVRPDPAEFTRDILPQLAGVSMSQLARDTGLSRRYIKLIVSGANVPHPLHWASLRAASNAPQRIA
jgi:CRISPR-associated endonuclease Cas1